MIEFNLSKFPRYTSEFFDDDFNSWVESLRNNGYSSASFCGPNYNGYLRISMDDIEYTHFVLRWS